MSEYEGKLYTQQELKQAVKAERERVKLGADKCYMHTCEYFSPECERHFAGVYCSWWQQLKQKGV